eukprot:Phypoly_transcript_06635.p1 GENE.Phypoly_transcript_06635~~Phypoly_transcript_06635.p1  ORF type:complete len:520 (+),score=74.89 Phypoly_transcript_06635:157-1716(+)
MSEEDSSSTPPVEEHKSHKRKSRKGKLQKQKSSFGRIAEHVLGYSPSKKEEVKDSLPPGYTVGYSKNGHPYLVKLGTESTDGADQEAADEHKRIRYPMSVSRETLGKRFGVGIYLYFDYLMYLIATNFVLLVLGVVSFAIHADRDSWDGMENYPYGRFSFFFYDKATWKNSKTPWLWINIAACLCWFLFGPIYSIRIRRYFKKRKNENLDIGEINLEDYIDVEDFIKGNEHITHQGRICRIALGYIIFVIVLAVSSIATFFLVVLSTSRRIQQLDTSSLLVSAIIAVFMTAVNMAWERVCVWLTKMEGHATWTKFRQHNTLKFFLFKMLNVLIMYASRVLVPRICPHIPSVRNYCNNSSCLASTVGVQLIFLLFFDLTAQNAWEIISGWTKTKLSQRRGMLGKGSNDSVRPEFDLAEEYLELAYRQFIIYLAFAIVPLVAVLGMLANMVEYRVDKYRLLRICQQPRGLQGSMRNFLTFFLFATAAVALASPPYGMAWVLSGRSQSMCEYHSSTDNSTLI